MFILLPQNYKTCFYLIPISVILGMYFYYSFQKLKRFETARLQLMYAELASEKEKEHQLKKATEDAEKIINNMQHKLLNIKIITFNINFSLCEIFN